MKWYYGGINIKKDNYDINAKLTSHYNVARSFYVNEYNIKNIKYVEATNNLYSKEEVQDGNLILFGDIYIKNIIQLREKYKLDNKSSFEVIKFMYKKKGIDFINEVYGAFSLVIVDYSKSTTYLIRDQIGERELFWGIIDNKIFFGSDLFLIDDFYNKTVLNSEYFKLFCENLGYTDFILTPYKNIFRVKSGSYVKIDMDNFKSNDEEYWKLEWVNDNWNFKSEEEYIEKFKELLIDSINNCTYKNKVNALSLSGGLDSTSIFAITRKYTNKRIKPYCGVFKELSTCDERQYINETMKMYNQEENYVELDDCGVLVDYPENYFYTSEPHINVLNKKFSEKIDSKVQEDNIEAICDGFFADHILTGNIIFLLDNKVSKKERKRILSEVSLKNEVDKLPDGIDTILSKEFCNGTELSGGQWQKIAIARSMIKDSDVVIFDEPTSALDPIAELEVFNLLNNVSNDKTTIMISHRLGITKFADTIIVMKDGKIIEKGSHEE
ncbi:ATP-binding cassette domain-containing protein [Clostridium butyricum]|uniref:ATP-binding cassette domain-containing protein n=1 Tax=Clostridium butyricum TaxID=1492 RepID=UPI003F90905D